MRKMKFVNQETIGDFLQEEESRLVEWGGGDHGAPLGHPKVRKVPQKSSSAKYFAHLLTCPSPDCPLLML